MTRHLMLSIAVAGTALAALAAWTYAAEPSEATRTIPYQGVLEMNGSPVNAATDFTFTLTDGDNADNTWTETHSAVPVSQGRFSVTLGSVKTDGVPAWAFLTSALDLQVGVNTTVVMDIKQRIQAVPYSVVADHAKTADYAAEAGHAAAADAVPWAGVETPPVITSITAKDASAVYVRTTEPDFFLGAGASGTTTASCDDINDIVLTGGCAGGHPTVRIWQNYPV